VMWLDWGSTIVCNLSGMRFAGVETSCAPAETNVPWWSVSAGNLG
jgi:hypothetical protein